MLIKYKWLGTSTNHFTQDSDYIVMISDAASACLLDDHNKLWQIALDEMNITSMWQLSSITEGATQVYPPPG